MPETSDSTSPNDDEFSGEVENGFSFNNDCGYLGVGRPGSMPFVSKKPGEYGRLLLAVYVRWKTGLFISADWLRPVTRALGGRFFWTERAIRTQCTVRSGPADKAAGYIKALSRNGGQLLPGDRHRHTKLSGLYCGYSEVNCVTSCPDTVVGYIRIVLCLSDFTSERTPWTRRGSLRRFVHIDRT